MKKLLLVIVVVAFSFTANAQDFRAGINVGLPVGDAGDAYTLNFGVDLSYMWNVSDDFDAGLSTGYSHFILDSEFNGDDASFLPLAGSARFNASEEFVLGADLGYGIGISPDGNDGGFYYRPLIGYNVGGNTQITASYSGVSVDGGTFSSINLGVNFGL
ncbi:hypothetical protein MWU50_14605 [Flavobacteriaceae bacterium S0862]|nr:hypothetical protein [Flavobacteriaceae bacterium S0862]